MFSRVSPTTARKTAAVEPVTIGCALLLGACSFACQARRSPLERLSPSATSAAVPPSAAGVAPRTAEPAQNPYLTEPSTHASTDVNVAMQLPQPLLEPTPEQDPSQYVAANPPWPATLTEIYGSELIRRIKETAQREGTKGVLINAWASWCGPCKVEMPLLLELDRRYEKRGIDVWFVSVDKSTEAARVEAVLRERAVPAPHYVVKGRLGYFKEALSPIWKGSLPSTFLFDADGRLRYYWGAQVFESELVPVLDDFLAGKPIDGMANFKVRRGSTDR